MKNAIGFIGTGNMGTAIIKGIANSPFAEKTEIYAFDVDKEKLNSLSEFGVKACENISETVSACKYVFLAVKPQMFGEVLDEVKPYVTKNTVLISIAAGITDTYIEIGRAHV